jgi:hypothetical protein
MRQKKKKAAEIFSKLQQVVMRTQKGLSYYSNFSVSMCFINSYNLVFTSRTSITQFINNN